MTRSYPHHQHHRLNASSRPGRGGVTLAGAATSAIACPVAGSPSAAPSSATTTWSVSTTPKSNQSLAAGGYDDLYKLKGVEKNCSIGLIGCGSYVRECPPRDNRYP
ncbi:hypothetical protein C4D60_Mb11t12290 [Musa balbisiana]|uniref:Uncharacterized protein n=1 Tax=Musa balbisiana TaxID=52838 RepID=A0A4S8J4G0_MUSBA|nr:hypothetical protein C4D60_Mb11t12290 [Musa balbisiana]